LEKLKSSDQWHLANAHSLLDKGNDPWQSYNDSAIDLSDAMTLLNEKK